MNFICAQPRSVGLRSWVGLEFMWLAMPVQEMQQKTSEDAKKESVSPEPKFGRPWLAMSNVSSTMAGHGQRLAHHGWPWLAQPDVWPTNGRLAMPKVWPTMAGHHGQRLANVWPTDFV